MQVLHLIDAAGPQTCPTTLAMLAQAQQMVEAAGGMTRALLLGSAELERAAWRAGVGRCHRLAAPYGHGALAWRAVQRWGRTLEPRMDLCHAWSVETSVLASLLFPRTPSLLTLTSEPSPRHRRWLGWLVRHRRALITLTATSGAIRDGLVAAAMPGAGGIQLVAPAVEADQLMHDLRPPLRRRWGITSDQTKVIALLSDPPAAADALAATLTAGIASEICRGRAVDLRILMHPRQVNLDPAWRMLRDLGQHHRLIVDGVSAYPWEALSACDVGFAIGPTAGGAAMAWALAAGLPIAAEATAAVRAALGGEHAALLAHPSHPRQRLAHHLSQLARNPALHQKMAAAARSAAAEEPGTGDFRRQLAKIYRAFPVASRSAADADASFNQATATR